MDHQSRIDSYNNEWDKIQIEKVAEILPEQMRKANCYYEYDEVYLAYIVSMVRQAANDDEAISDTIRNVIGDEFANRSKMMLDLKEMIRYTNHSYSDEDLQTIITKTEKMNFALNGKRSLSSLMHQAIEEINNEHLLKGLNYDQMNAAYRKVQKIILSETARSFLIPYTYERSIDLKDIDFTLSEIVDKYIKDNRSDVPEEDMWTQVIDEYFTE